MSDTVLATFIVFVQYLIMIISIFKNKILGFLSYLNKKKELNTKELLMNITKKKKLQ